MHDALAARHASVGLRQTIETLVLTAVLAFAAVNTRMRRKRERREMEKERTVSPPDERVIGSEQDLMAHESFRSDKRKPARVDGKNTKAATASASSSSADSCGACDMSSGACASLASQTTRGDTVVEVAIARTLVSDPVLWQQKAPPTQRPIRAQRTQYLTTNGVNDDLLLEDGGTAEGGFGAVTFFATRDLPTERFALKIAKDTPSARRQMKREMDFFDRIQCFPAADNIVQVVAMSNTPQPMILTRREKAALSDILANGGAENMRSVAMVLDDVLSGVDFLFGIGYLHRDIKPDNILVSSDDKGMLVDFGLCLESKDALVRGRGDGTPEYSAPEVTRAPWTLSAELYSVFVCFVEAVIGRCPFSGEELLLDVKENRLLELGVSVEILTEQVNLHREEGEDEDNATAKNTIVETRASLRTALVQQWRLGVDMESWTPDDRDRVERKSMGEPLALFMVSDGASPARCVMSLRSPEASACIEAKENPGKLFELDWVNWLPSSSRLDSKAEMERTIRFMMSKDMLSPDHKERPRTVTAAKELLRAALAVFEVDNDGAAVVRSEDPGMLADLVALQS